MEIFEPDKRRISVILVPLRPMMHPTMSEGMEMFWVRRLAAGGLETGEWGVVGEPGGEVRPRALGSPLLRREPAYDDE